MDVTYSKAEALDLREKSDYFDLLNAPRWQRVRLIHKNEDGFALVHPEGDPYGESYWTPFDELRAEHGTLREDFP